MLCTKSAATVQELSGLYDIVDAYTGELLCQVYAQGHLELAQLLNSYGGCKKHKIKVEALFRACPCRHLQVAQWLRDMEPMHDEHQRCFRVACEGGQLHIAQ